MSRARRSWPLALVALLAAAASVGLLALAAAIPSKTAVFNDFYHEAWPAYQALLHGHVLTFVRLGPPYVGSLVLRAPFALIPRAWGGGWQAVYIASAVPCMIALVAFCTWLAAQPRRHGGIGWASRVGPILICFLNPAVFVAVVGDRHPEEVLGAVLCIAGVVLASRGTVGWAAFLTGLAVVNKQWALVAVPVVLAAMPIDRRRGLSVMAATAASVLVPVTLARVQSISAGAAGAQLGSQVGGIFNPPQLLWWFGPHSWIAGAARPIFVLAAVASSALWWARRRGARAPAGDGSDALLLLALVLLLRAALDPWNNLYYHVPFLLALMAWEVRSGRMPSLTIAYEFVLLIVVPIDLVKMAPDLRAVLYAAVVVPTIVWMGVRLLAVGGAPRRSTLSGYSALPGRARTDRASAP